MANFHVFGESSWGQLRFHQAVAAPNDQQMTWSGHQTLELSNNPQSSRVDNPYALPTDQHIDQRQIAKPPSSPFFLHNLQLELRDIILDLVVDGEETIVTIGPAREEEEAFGPRFASVPFTRAKSGVFGVSFDAREQYAGALVRAVRKRRLIASVTIMDLDFSVVLRHLLQRMADRPYRNSQGEEVSAYLKFRMHFSEEPKWNKVDSLKEYLQWRYDKMQAYGEYYMTTLYDLAPIGVEEGHSLGPALTNLFPVKELENSLDAREIYRFLFYICYVRQVDMGEDCIDNDELRANFSPIKPSGLAGMGFSDEERDEDDDEDDDDSDDESEEEDDAEEDDEEVHDNSDPTRWDGFKVPGDDWKK